MKIDMKKSLTLGAWVAATVLIVNFALSFFKISVNELFSISGTTGLTSTIGEKVIATLNKLIAFDPISILYLFLSASAIVFVGGLVVDNLPVPKGKEDWHKLALVLLYGTAVFYLILVGFGLPAMGTLVGLAVYYSVVALSLGIFQKQVKKFI
jgi:phosphatidylserine synthase